MSDMKKLQGKILEIMKFIDKVCKENNIKYAIMGGTALGAIRHKGFIPWDDDLDIFMTIEEYEKFKKAFNKLNQDKFVLQEWRVVDEYLEYAKVRMNGTTFIEEAFKDKKDLHQGIYVDIMILHKCPKSKLWQKVIYYISKYLVLVGLMQRNWKPKTISQKIILNIAKFLPNKFLAYLGYKLIYHFDKSLKDNFVWCYYITKAKFHQGIFDKNMFEELEEIEFEDTKLLAPKRIKEYLKIRYGDYMKLPPESERKENIHALIWDTEKDYKEYLNG
ncbi:MAG: LicD family protein [Nautiliaceae bacterium]